MLGGEREREREREKKKEKTEIAKESKLFSRFSYSFHLNFAL